jgi:hypothetical protein
LINILIVIHVQCGLDVQYFDVSWSPTLMPFLGVDWFGRMDMRTFGCRVDLCRWLSAQWNCILR